MNYSYHSSGTNRYTTDAQERAYAALRHDPSPFPTYEHSPLYEDADPEDPAFLAGARRQPRVAIFWPSEWIKPHSGVLVFGYHHAKEGRVKRAYLHEFDSQERTAIAKLYNRAWQWEMRTGHPDRIKISLKTYDLLVRAAGFFASH